LATAADAVCRDTIVVSVSLTEKILSAEFGYQLQSCTEDTLTLQLSDLSQNSLDNTTAWHWTLSGVYNDTLTGPDIALNLTQEGTLTVSLTITTEEGCQSATLPVSFPVDLTELPNLPDGSETLGCLNGGVVLNANGDASYTYAWLPTEGLSCYDCPSPLANPSQTTTYQVVVRNISADTCDIIRQVTVTVPTDLAVSLPDDVQTCEPSVTLVATADLPPADWTWFDDGQTVVATGSGVFSVAVSGDRQYVLQAADSLGCLYFDTIRVAGGPVDLAAAAEQVVCSDTLPSVGAENLDPNDVLTLLWSPADAFDGPLDIPAPTYLPVPGTQWVYVDAQNQWGCNLRDSVLVAIVDIDQALDFDFVVGCDGFEVSFSNLSTGTANHPFVWQFGDPASLADSSTLTNPGHLYTSEGTFLVSLTLGYDLPCVDTAFQEIQIEETQFLTDFDYDFLNCDEDSIQVQFLDATQLFINSIDITCWEWTTLDGQSSTEQNPVFTAYAGQPFGITLKVCTSNGCEGTRSALLNFDFPVISLADTIFLCQGDSVGLYPGADGAYLYSWTPDLALSDPNSPNPTAWPTATQTYTVDITTFTLDTCQLSRTVTVVVPEKMSLLTTGDTLTCGQPVQLEASLNVSPADIAWYDGQGNLLAADSPVIPVNPDSNDTYTVVATDSYHCTDTATISVFNRQLDLQLTGGGIIDTCPAPSYDLCVTNLDLSDNLVFEWSASSNGTILDCPDCGCATVQTIPGTQATFFVTVSNQYGCETVAELDVTTYVFDPIFRELLVICPGVPTPVNPDAAGSDLSYQWSPPLGLSCQDCPNPTATLTDNQFYQVTIQGFNANDICSLTGTVQVQVNPVMDLTTAPTDTVICEATDLTLSALSGSNLVTDITWATDPALSNPLGSGPSLQVNTSGSVTYYAVATDTLGCRDTASVTVDAYPVVTSLDDQFDFCVESGPLTLAVTNLDPAQVLQYQWSPAAPIIEANADSGIVTVDITASTTFTVTATNQFGCTGSETAAVSFVDIAGLVGDILLEDDTIILGSGESTRLVLPFFPGYSYAWSPEDGLDDPGSHQPLAEPTETTGYSVLITDPAGCQVLRSDTVYVISPDCREPNIFVPNAFTPNGDGENDLLFVRSSVIDQVEFAIYNRWGQKIFETTDKSVGWDGTFKGEVLAPDMFGYYLKATCFDGQTFFRKGNVTILR
jgi:gliding motility-associated-like protein